jgi:hypothetical protein
VQIKGQGSGYTETETGRESEEPIHINITYVDTLSSLLRIQEGYMQQS